MNPSQSNFTIIIIIIIIIIDIFCFLNHYSALSNVLLPLIQKIIIAFYIYKADPIRKTTFKTSYLQASG